MRDRLYVQHILLQLRVQKDDRYAPIGGRCPDALAEFEVLLVDAGVYKYSVNNHKYSCFSRCGRCADYEGANHEGAHNQGPDQGSDQGSDQGAHDRGADYASARPVCVCAMREWRHVQADRRTKWAPQAVWDREQWTRGVFHMRVCRWASRCHVQKLT